MAATKGTQVVADPVQADPPNQPEVQQPEAQAPETFDYEAWYNDQLAKSPKALEEIGQRAMSYAQQQFNQQLEEQYGDIMPLWVEAKKDPEFRKALKENLTDPELRKFLFSTAVEAYRGVNKANAEPQGTEDNPLAKRVDELQSKLDSQQQERERNDYVSRRSLEMQALQREAPELAFKEADSKDPAYRLAAHITEVAESRSERFGKPVSYKDVYLEMRDVINREKPPAAPATSRTQAPPKPQAPQTKAEGRDRALDTLKRAGGIAGLARTAGARR